MKDEIKEILDRWNKVCNGELLSTDMTLDEMIMFRDYITNLQEEYRKADEDRHELFDRIDKAIEYIENDLKSFLYSIEYKTLLNILNGGDE